jgi:4-hydroxybenzoate polyprenyltransferase
LLASCIYVINDIWDLDADRQHHDKKERPFASGRLPLSFAAILIPACLLGSMLMAASLPLVFWKVLGSYLIITSLYTFHLKSIAIADVMILAGLYSIRLLAGGVVAGIQLSPWLLAFSGFFFVSLAMVKRTSELLSLHEMGKDKPLGRGYRVADIPTLSGLGTASGYGAVLIMALYINSGVAGSNYQRDELLWLFCPILMYWISRVWLLTNRGEIDSDPVKFAIKDRFSWGCVLTVFVIWAIASGYVH